MKKKNPQINWEESFLYNEQLLYEQKQKIKKLNILLLASVLLSITLFEALILIW